MSKSSGDMSDTDWFEETLQGFLAGPARAFCFYNGRWWHLSDGHWTQHAASDHLTRALLAVADDLCTGSKDHRCRDYVNNFLTQRTINQLRLEVRRPLTRFPGLPGRFNTPTPRPDAAPAPPAPPGPAETSGPAHLPPHPGPWPEHPADTAAPAGPEA